MGGYHAISTDLSLCLHACNLKPYLHAICLWCQSHPKVSVIGHTQALHPADLV